MNITKYAINRTSQLNSPVIPRGLINDQDEQCLTAASERERIFQRATEIIMGEAMLKKRASNNDEAGPYYMAFGIFHH